LPKRKGSKKKNERREEEQAEKDKVFLEEVKKDNLEAAKQQKQMH
jgi:hypothetical protein